LDIAFFLLCGALEFVLMFATSASRFGRGDLPHEIEGFIDHNRKTMKNQTSDFDARGARDDFGAAGLPAPNRISHIL
jgi:hypothetical protein